MTERYGLPSALKDGCVLFIPGEVNGTTAFDISGNGNHGTLVNSPTPTRGGLYGYKGFKFDGTSQYVTIPNATLNVSEFTLAATVNVTAGGGDDVIFHFRNQENTNGWCIFAWSKGDGGRTVNSPYFAFYADDLNTSVGLDTGRTYRMVARYKGGVQSIFVDGKLFASRTAAANPMTPTTSRIGVRSDTLTQYLGGNVTNPIIWNRGLTDDQIRLDASTFFVP